jgi:undecaprenyl-phosphate galactose phosphotransferase
MRFIKRAIKKYSWVNISLSLGDFIALFVSILITLSIGYKKGSLLLRSPFAKEIQLLFYLLVAASTLVLFMYNNLYKPRIYLTFFDQFSKIVKSVLWSSAILIVVVFFTKWLILEDNARVHYALFFITSISLTFTFRSIFLKTLNKKNKFKSLFQRRIVAVGAGKVGYEFSQKINDSKIKYFDLTGFIDDDPEKRGTLINGYPVLGQISELEDIIQDHKIDEIFITIQSISYDALMKLIAECKKSGDQVNLVSSHYNVIHRKFDAPIFDNLQYITIYSSLIPFYTHFLKGILDKLITSVLLIILIPFFLMIGLAIKLTSKGPVFYKTKVVGRDGKPFTWRKFRTMRAGNHQEIHQKHLEEIIKQNKSVEKLKNDPRITTVGKFLRKYSIDELPQLFSIMKGDMSLVGPRPCLPFEYKLMDEWQKRRTKVTPGITGLWQIAGRNKKDVTFNDSIVLDLYYAENQSFWLDFKIFIKTFPVVLLGRGGV